MYLKFEDIRVAGVAVAVPKTCQLIKDSLYGTPEERLKFTKTTGISSRRLAENDQCASDLCFVAAEKLIKELNWDKKEIELLVFVTQNPDYIIPSTAIILQNRLGLEKTCAAFDVNLGCSGYTYGIALISSFLSNMKPHSKALLLVGDTSSKNVTPSHLTTTPPLFGDCGSATAMTRVPSHDISASPIYISLNSDGKGANIIMHQYGMYRQPFTEHNFRAEVDGFGNLIIDTGFLLDGLEVFNFSVKEVPESINALLMHWGIKRDEIDFFVFHQANKLINETIRKVLKVPLEKTPYSLDEYGNTSSATIPITIVSRLREKVINNKHHLLLSGFGVGLSWANVILDLDHIVCPSVIEL